MHLTFFGELGHVFMVRVALALPLGKGNSAALLEHITKLDCVFKHRSDHGHDAWGYNDIASLGRRILLVWRECDVTEQEELPWGNPKVAQVGKFASWGVPIAAVCTWQRACVLRGTTSEV